jgi:hypothetical protein
MDGVAEIEYVGAACTPAQLRAAIDEILTHGDEPGTESVATFASWRAQETKIDIRVAGEGFDPTTVAVVVAFAPAANHMVMSLWDDVILPRLRRKLGDDALGKERRRR